MRVLLIHADSFHYKVTGATSAVHSEAELPAEMASGGGEEIIVAYIAVEEGDEKDVDSVIKQGVEEIAGLALKVMAQRVIIYPYAHLSSNLNSPRVATRVLDGIFDGILAGKYPFEALRAPFGWYKAFSVSCKGHPLSELARTIVPEGLKKTEEVSQALKAEKEKKSVYIVLTQGGDEIPLEKFNFEGREEFHDLVRYDTEGSRISAEMAAHIKIMREQELVDYEPASDSGNFRWYPKGYLMKKIMEEYVSGVLRKYGAMQIETPIMYDYQHPNLNKYLNRFPARQYIVKSDEKELFLRFAACFGQYMMKHDMKISYRHLPLRLYELTHHSFRREQSGELSGLKRLRTFTMPDMHTLCMNIEQAKEEFANQVKLSMDWMKDMELPYEVSFRFVRSFYEENRDMVLEISKIMNKDFLIELWEQRFFYFIMKIEFNVIDGQKKASTLSTVQIDVENTERFDITYTNEKGEKEHPIMLHTSISGSIDRCMYALLEREAIRMSKGEKGRFPLWLAPVQVRILPVSSKFEDESYRIFEKINFRADFDDRDESLSKKIRAAEKEWVPMIAVVGAKELQSGRLMVRFRDGAQKEMSAEEINNYIRVNVQGKPYIPLNFPLRLSLRPVFVG